MEFFTEDEAQNAKLGVKYPENNQYVTKPSALKTIADDTKDFGLDAIKLGSQIDEGVAKATKFLTPNDSVLHHLALKDYGTSENMVAWADGNERYHQIQEQYANPVANFIGQAFPFLVGGILTDVMKGASVTEKVAKGTEELSGLADEVAQTSEQVSNADKLTKKGIFSQGIVPRMAAYNATVLPFVAGHAVHSDNNGNTYFDLGEFGQNMLFAQLSYAGIEGIGYAGRAIFGKGSITEHYMQSRRDKAASKRAKQQPEPVEAPEPSIEERQQTAEKKGAASILGEDVVKKMDETINNPDKPYTVSDVIKVPEETSSDYQDAINIHANSRAQDEFRRSVLSRGIIHNGKLVDITQPESILPIQHIVDGIKDAQIESGTRQWYYSDLLNKELEARHKNGKDNAELNQLDKLLFKTHPWRIKGSIDKESMYYSDKGESNSFVLDNNVGHRTTQYPTWYRSNQIIGDNEALIKLNNLANKGEQAAKIMQAIANESSASKARQSLIKGLFAHIEDAIRNPKTEDEIKANYASAKDNFNDEASAQRMDNIDALKDKYEKADLSSLVDIDSTFFVKLLSKMDDSRFSDYIKCMVG